jgi:hypothetical protein
MSDGQEPQNLNDTPPEPAGTPPEPAAPKTFDESYVRELRAEAAKNRKAARDLEKQLQQFQAEKDAAAAKELEAQGEWQKLAEQESARRAELEKQIEAQAAQLANEQRSRTATGIAASLGAIDPTDPNFIAAVANVDVSAIDATAQIQQALEALKEARPYLFQGQRQSNLASFNPAHGPQPEPKETDAQRRERIYGGGRGIFDPDKAPNLGGGVVIQSKNLE